MKDKIIIGTRGSPLALAQATQICQQLQATFEFLHFELKVIKTTGDVILDAPLAQIGGKGLFTKEIDKALLAGTIDLAVHSLKDLPTEMEKGLMLGTITKREDPRDILISKGNLTLKELPSGAVVATSSLRRRAQLKHYRPDLELADMRGNLDTRLKKLRSHSGISALVLSKAGLSRLGLAGEITEHLDTDIILPAAGQGALAIEVRQDDQEMLQLIQGLADQPTTVSTLAERSLLAHLEGGCQVPIGVYGRLEAGQLKLEALVATLDGQEIFRDLLIGEIEKPEELGRALAEKLLAMGAGKILEEIRKKF